MRPPRLLLLVVLALLAGCGGGDDDDGGGGATRTAPGGAEVDGTGYRFTAPQGWRDASAALQGSAIRVDRVYAGPARDGFTTNVTVVRETPRGVTLAAVEPAFRRQASALADDAGVSRTQRRTLDGAPARTWTYRLRQGGGRQRQLFAVRDGALYTLTFSAAARSFAAQERVFTRILASWRWEA